MLAFLLSCILFFLLSCFLVGPLLCCFLVLICSCFCFCFCLFYLLLVLFPSLFSCLSFLTFLFSCCPFTFLLSCFTSLSYFLVVSCACCAGSCCAVPLVVPCRAVQFFSHPSFPCCAVCRLVCAVRPFPLHWCLLSCRVSGRAVFYFPVMKFATVCRLLPCRAVSCLCRLLLCRLLLCRARTLLFLLPYPPLCEYCTHCRFRFRCPSTLCV